MHHDLELIGIGKVFDNGTPAVVDFDLSVATGEFIAFLGPSGCGKTTTLRIIAGFESITSGDLMIKGERVNDAVPARRPTSMIFQSYALFPHMTVRRNVGYGLEVRGVAKPAYDEKVDRILDRFGLADVAAKRCDRLSGGQRQRIALARGLVVEPAILLLDEPLGALDANLRKTIQSELKLLQRDLGVTFVFVTHAQSEALALSDRIVVMNKGRIEQVSTPHELYTRPQTPFVAQFIGCNTVFDGTVRGRDGATVVVETALGAMAGTPNGHVSDGATVSIVIPAEAIHLEACPSGSGDRLQGEVRRVDVVGHVAHVSLGLPGGRSVSLEAHTDEVPPGTIAPGARVALVWRPEDASVIPARPHEARRSISLTEQV